MSHRAFAIRTIALCQLILTGCAAEATSEEVDGQGAVDVSIDVSTLLMMKRDDYSCGGAACSCTGGRGSSDCQAMFKECTSAPICGASYCTCRR